jgi:hypothetical protein
MTVSDYNYPFSARTEENVEPLILQALQDSDVMAAVGAVQQNWRNSGNESLIAATRANSIVSGTGAVLKPDVASGQADASIPVGGYFSVYNNVTLKVDIYQKGASTATLVYTQSTDAQTSLNTNALATINEVVTQLPITVTPPAATDPYQEVWTTITNPEIRWTKSIVSGALQVLQNYLGVICYGIQHKTSVLTANLVIEAEFGASGVSVNTGYCLSFNDTTTFDASHGRLLQLRQTGAMLAVWGTGAGTTTGITVTGVPSLPYNAGDIVIMRLVVGADPTAGTLYIVINGEVLGIGSVTGLPTGTQYLGASLTQNGAVGQSTAQIRRFQTHPLATDQTRWRTININGTGTDKGTEANPFLTIQSAVRDFSDHPGRSAKLTLKGGIYRFPIITALRSWRELTIRGEKGADVIIHGSSLLTSGWTKTAGATNVYQRPTIADGLVVNSNTGGIIDLGAGMDLSAYDVTTRGLSPTPRLGQTIPYNIYERLSPVNGTTILLATQIAACDAKPGSMFNDATLAGKTTYVHCLNNADPNTQQLEWCNRTNALRVLWGAAGDWNDCRINLVSLHFQYAYNHVVQVQRAQVLVEECIAEGSAVGNGFNFDACGGSMYGGEARYSYNDGVHSDAVDLPTNIIRPQFRMFDVYTHHQLVGDGVSNHERTEHIGYGMRANYNGKAGYAQIDNCRLYSCQMKGNHLAFYTGSQTVVQTIFTDLVDCDISDTGVGLNSGSTTAGCKSIMTVRGGRMANTGNNTEPSPNVAASIDAADVGGSTLSITGMRDDGNNGTIGPAIIIDGRPGDVGVPRTSPAANIASKADPVNTRGKAPGRTILDTVNNRLMVAYGRNDTDPWRSANGDVTVTPV